MRGKKLRDTPWGDPLLTAVEQRQEVYEATDRALDEIKASAKHRAAVWEYAILSCAQFYTWLRGDYITRRVITLQATMDGNLWHWLEACSDDQRREFREQYMVKHGPPRFKVAHPARPLSHVAATSRRTNQLPHHFSHPRTRLRD